MREFWARAERFVGTLGELQRTPLRYPGVGLRRRCVMESQHRLIFAEEGGARDRYSGVRHFDRYSTT